MRKGLFYQLSSIAFIIIVIGSYVIVAQSPISGTWTADARDDKDADKIELQLSRRSMGDRRNQIGRSYEYSELEGLTASQTRGGKVSFRIVREAGTIDLEGSFTDGRGSGTFTFTPSRSYVDAMKSRGFDFSRSKFRRSRDDASTERDDLEDRLFVAAALNVTTKLADDLLSANFGPLDVDDLFKAAIFKITPEFMSEMKASGFPDLSMEDLVKARIFKIDAAWVRDVHAMGFAGSDFEQLVRFRIFKVTPEFLHSLKSEGYADLSAEQVVRFRIFNVDADFIRQAKASDPSVTPEQLVEMRMGIRRMARGR
ncbi:MAG: hypothetical protein ACK4S4_12255 [Pyrinomonadaceae bacterium]